MRASTRRCMRQHLATRSSPASAASASPLFHQTSYGSREDGNDWTGNSVYLWAIANAVYMSLLGPRRLRRGRRADPRSAATTRPRALAEIAGRPRRWPDGFFKEFVVDFGGTGKTVAEINRRLRDRGIFGGKDLSARLPRDSGRARSTASPRCTPQADIDRLVDALAEVVGDERAAPLSRGRLGRAARHGDRARRAAAAQSSAAERGDAVGDAERSCRRRCAARRRPALPELSEPEVLRHYLHLSQETLGMMGVSLFGTCTMKYNPRARRARSRRGPSSPSCTRTSPRRRSRACSSSIHGLDLILRELSGMDRFVFQAGGGAARRLHASPASPAPTTPPRGELEQRDEVDHHDPGASVQRGDGGGGRLQGRDAAARGATATRRSPRCKAAVSERTAALMVEQPGRHGHLQPATSTSGSRSSTRRAGSASTTTPTSTA